MSELIKLLSGSAIEVNRIAAVLKEQNISAMVKDHLESAKVAGFGVPQNTVELYVNKTDAEKAAHAVSEMNEA